MSKETDATVQIKGRVTPPESRTLWAHLHQNDETFSGWLRKQIFKMNGKKARSK